MSQVTATLRKDSLSKKLWLQFEGKPGEPVLIALKAAGWRWSGFRKQWYSQSQYSKIPAGIETIDGGACNYAAERADRLEARAAGHNQKAQQHLEKFQAHVDSVPVGQPIIKGHHSQRSQENAQKRAGDHLHVVAVESATADRLASAANRSRDHQDNLTDTGTISRRLKRLEKEAKKLGINIGKANDPEYRRTRQARLEVIEAQIEADKKALSDAGGLVADSDQLTIGDIVMVEYWGKCEVMRLNAKSVKVKPLEENSAGGVATVDKTRVKRLVQKAATSGNK